MSLEQSVRASRPNLPLLVLEYERLSCGAWPVDLLGFALDGYAPELRSPWILLILSPIGEHLLQERGDRFGESARARHD